MLIEQPYYTLRTYQSPSIQGRNLWKKRIEEIQRNHKPPDSINPTHPWTWRSPWEPPLLWVKPTPWHKQNKMNKQKDWS
jgi:hypothetical protein